MEAFLVSAGMSAGTAATVSTAMTVASTAFSVLGALSSAGQASANYKAQAQASEYNAAVARNESQRALQESTARQVMHRRQTAQFLGSQRAAAAQSGTGFGGSTGDVLDQSATLAELDALNIAYEGDVRSRGFMAQSDLDSYYATVSRRNASSARTGGYIGALAAGAHGLSQALSVKKSTPTVLTGGAGRPTSSLNVYGTVRYG